MPEQDYTQVTYFVTGIEATETLRSSGGRLVPISVRVTAEDLDGAEHQLTTTRYRDYFIGQALTVSASSERETA